MVYLVLFFPVEFNYFITFNSPFFKMFSNSKGSNHLFHLRFYLFNKWVIKMVVVIVSEQKKIDFGEIFSGINICSRKRSSEEFNWRGVATKNGIYKNSESLITEKIRRMPKPDHRRFFIFYFCQIGFNMRKLFGRSYR